MYQAQGYAAQSSSGHLEPFTFARRDLRENDLLIDILYCGVCHSDLHTARGEWHCLRKRNPLSCHPWARDCRTSPFSGFRCQRFQNRRSRGSRNHGGQLQVMHELQERS